MSCLLSYFRPKFTIVERTSIQYQCVSKKRVQLLHLLVHTIYIIYEYVLYIPNNTPNKAILRSSGCLIYHQGQLQQINLYFYLRVFSGKKARDHDHYPADSYAQPILLAGILHASRVCAGVLMQKDSPDSRGQ